MEKIEVGLQHQLQLLPCRAVGRKAYFWNLAAIKIRFQKEQGHSANLELRLFGVAEYGYQGIALKGLPVGVVRVSESGRHQDKKSRGNHSEDVHLKH